MAVVQMHYLLAIGLKMLITFAGVVNLGKCLNLGYYLIALSHVPFSIRRPHLIG